MLNNKKLLPYLGVVLVAGMVLSGCTLLKGESAPAANDEQPQNVAQDDMPQDMEKKDAAVTAAQLTAVNGTYTVAPEKSSIEWAGSKKLVRTSDHTGTVAVKSGSITVEEGVVSEGTVVVDMTSLTSTDVEGAMRDKLDGHLRSDDFFGVETHPEATLEITSVTPKPTTDEEGAVSNGFDVQADVTIKGITNPVEFEAMVEQVDETMLVVSAPVTLDRTQWDIQFGSEQFFDNLGDNVINDEFTLNVMLTAMK